MPRQHAWEDGIDGEIRQLEASYTDRVRLGQRPALLCIDNYNAVFGDRPEPILEAIKRFPSSCGPSAWDTVEPTQRLMSAAREVGIPLIHTTRDLQNQAPPREMTSTKRHAVYGDPVWESAFFDRLAPGPDELVIHKTRASAFFGTPSTPTWSRWASTR